MLQRYNNGARVITASVQMKGLNERDYACSDDQFALGNGHEVQVDSILIARGGGRRHAQAGA